MVNSSIAGLIQDWAKAGGKLYCLRAAGAGEALFFGLNGRLPAKGLALLSHAPVVALASS
ncbi:hypothetical protein POKO110462_10270 [Pontibacter korlensis]|uniref:Uncharacterized protein n=1 Tax=Pontibacter korlensis TaxID=400092 RepID=A0A0E3UUN6_9BACT|nr:hypothetical protein [Pontibacter korlensis]AKD01917.1 hypothetical protein PKOR_00600 [Pontibacter korlensis]